MAISTMTVDHAVNLIAKGFEVELCVMIESRLRAVVDAEVKLITAEIEQLAEQAAKNTVARVEAFHNTGPSSPFGEQVIQFRFQHKHT